MRKKFVRKLKKCDPWIFIAVFILMGFGTLMVGSAAIGNAAVAAATSKGVSSGVDSIMTIVKQGLFVFVGIVAMFFTMAIYDHNRINRQVARFLLIIMIGSLLVCRLFGATNGAYAWINLGIMTIQPSEFCKLLLILLLAYYSTQFPPKLFPKKKSHYMTFRNGEKRYKKVMKKYIGYCWVLPIVVVLFEIGIVVFYQNDTGSAIITLLICVACFFMTPSKYYGGGQKLLLGCGIGGVALLLLVFGFSSTLSSLGISFNFGLKLYQLERFSSWLNPLGSPYGASAQLANALIAITKGKYFGVGLFNSTQKFGFIPEVETDFITSLVLEEFGLVGLALIIVPYSIIIFRLLHFGLKARSNRSSIILVGIASYFFLHLFINLGGVSGLIPMTGVPLIFVSQGGSSVLAGSISLGVAQATIALDKVADRKARRKALENG